MRIVLDDAGSIGLDLHATIVRMAALAWRKWSAALELPRDIAITVEVTDTIPYAAASYAWGGDITIAINPAYYRQFADLNPSWLPGDPIAPGKDAPDYVFLHELGHALFQGNSPGSNWASRVTTIDGQPFFVGPHTMALHGGPAALTPDGFNAHLASAQDPRLALNVMSGIAPDRNFEQLVEPINVAMALDCFLQAAIAPPRELVEIYVASFNRAPDSAGFDYWAGRLADGAALADIARSFFVQPEAAAFYPPVESTATFVEKVYGNALGRPSDAGGLAWWTGALDRGEVSREGFLLDVLSGAKAFPGSADARTLAARAEVGEHFLSWKLDDTATARAVMAGVRDDASAAAAERVIDAFAVSIVGLADVAT